MVHDAAFTARDLVPGFERLDVSVELLPLSSTLSMARKIRSSKAEIVHAHYIRSPAYAAYVSFKRPYVLHAHGDDVRHGIGFFQRIAMNSAAMIFYATDDIRIQGGVKISQPVNLDLFKPIVDASTIRKALYMLDSNASPKNRILEQAYVTAIKQLCEKEHIDVEIRERLGIPHEEMPKFLSQFQLFFDKSSYPGAYSKTALECSAMGMCVLGQGDFKMRDTSPPTFELDLESAKRKTKSMYEYVVSNHSSDAVAKKLLGYYEEILSRAK